MSEYSRTPASVEKYARVSTAVCTFNVTKEDQYETPSDLSRLEASTDPLDDWEITASWLPQPCNPPSVGYLTDFPPVREITSNGAVTAER